MSFAVPIGWEYEGSLSADFAFVPTKSRN
jgi:hypothetical protein